MGAAVLQFFGELHIIFQRIFIALGICDIAGIANGGLGDFVLIEHFFQRNLHAGQPVERIENAEHINAVLGAFFDERAHNIVRIVFIAHGIGPAEQHLEQNVGNAGAQFIQAFPGGFVQEAIGHVKRGAAPHFQRKRRGENMGSGIRSQRHIVGTHARCQQRLMRIAHGGICDQQLLFFQKGLGNGPGALFIQKLFIAAFRNGRFDVRRYGHGDLRLWQAIFLHDVFADIGQHFIGAVFRDLNIKQRGRGIDKERIALAGEERFVLQDVHQKRHIGLYAAHADFAQRTERFAGSADKGTVRCGDFYQQAVIIRGDDGACKGVAGIQPNPVAAATAIQRDFPGIRRKVVARVFGGHTALNGIAVLMDGFLGEV